MIRRLAKDSQRLTTLRRYFREHLRRSRGYLATHGSHSEHRDLALKLLGDIEGSIDNMLSDLDSTLKELLQIVF